MRISKRAIYFSFALIFIGAISVFFRFIMDDPGKLPAGDSAWELRWDFYLSEVNPGSEIRLATPIDTQNIQVFEQDIALEGLRIRRSRVSKDGTREIVAHSTQQQDVRISVDFAVHLSSLGIPHYIKKKDVLNAKRRQNYLAANEYLPVNNENVINLLQLSIKDVREPELIFKSLFDYCTNKIKDDPKNLTNDVLDVIVKKSASARGKARLLTTLARIAKIPARMVMGLILSEEGEVFPHYWVEINVNDAWQAYDPSNGFSAEVPVNYLPIRKDGEFFLSMPESMNLKRMSLEVAKRDMTVSFFDIEKN